MKPKGSDMLDESKIEEIKKRCKEGINWIENNL
jgi:hypothetical protein